jgi:hypothetical protein
MTDLVKRLREEPYPYEKRHGLGITAMEVWHKTACEAADEIERLRKLTENDAKEIGSYREGTGLRGENRRLRDALEEIASGDIIDSDCWDIAREALKDG